MGHPRDLYLARFYLTFFLVMFPILRSVDFRIYAEDNTIHGAGGNTDKVIFSLQESSKTLFNGLLII